MDKYDLLVNLKCIIALNQKILAVAESIDNEVCKGKEQLIYQFGDTLMDKEDVKLTQTKLMLSKFKRPIHLNLEDPYQ